MVDMACEVLDVSAATQFRTPGAHWSNGPGTALAPSRWLTSIIPHGLFEAGIASATLASARASMLTSLPLLVCIGAGLVAGVFFAFSSFVMKALAGLPAAEGIAAMQRINVVVLNPLFLGVFVGTAVLSAMCVIAAFFPWGTTRSLLLLTAGLVYLLGSFGVTAAFNVPRNKQLAVMAADSVEAREYWPVYVREWLRWNHVRTVASVASSVSVASALAC